MSFGLWNAAHARAFTAFSSECFRLRTTIKIFLEVVLHPVVAVG
jgi:hypothetical protein